MNLILFGFKGSGKSHFGRLLAQKLHHPFIDTDALIVHLYTQATGYSITTRAIYQAIGEEAFRTLERKALSTLLNLENTVVAVGGGAVLDPHNVALLTEIGTLIYLEASLATIRKRGISDVTGSPIEAKYAERLPIYQSIPAVRINTDTCNENRVIANILIQAIFRESNSGV